jgi:hypothetical protein
MTFDRNVFTQMGIDSGALTMLSAITHCFHEAGEYRGTVRNERGESLAVLYISVDKESSVAQVNIDLASLDKNSVTRQGYGECEDTGNRFTVNPKGYAVFHVSEGKGGYNVHIRKAEQETQQIFDSRNLNHGDIFSGVIIRPGQYSVSNTFNKSRAEIIVSYPRIEKTAYRPPGPLRIEVTENGFVPDKIELNPGQGLSFDCRSSARIKIELHEPYDRSSKPKKAYS